METTASPNSAPRAVPRRADTLALLRSLEPELRQRKVVTLSLFGSVARDEAGPDSDVDVLVGTQRPFSLFDFVGVNRHLEAALGRPVDVVHEDKLEPLAPMDALHPPMRAGLLRDLVRVF